MKKIQAKKNNNHAFISKLINKKMQNPLHKPKSTSDIVRVFFKGYHEPSSVMQLDENTFSVCFEYQDISFAKANYDQQESIFLEWVKFLHSFHYQDHIQIIHAGKAVKTKDYKKGYIYQEELLSSSEKKIAKEFNHLIESSLGNKEQILCETRQIVISTKAESLKDAQDLFLQYQLKTEEKFKELKGRIRRVTIQERFEVLYNLFNANLLNDANIHDVIEYAKENKLSVYDVLAAKEDVSFREKNYIKIGNHKYIRVMYIAKLPHSITPRFYNRLTTLENGNVITTINITPTDPAKVIKKIDKKISGMKTERLEKVKKALKNNYSYEVVRDEKLEETIEDAQELRDALGKKKQKIFENNILICMQSDSFDDLEKLTKQIQSIGNEHLISIHNLDWQQLEGLQNALAFGWNTIQFQRSLTSESTAVNVPFNTKDLMHENSIYYGINLVSKNPIFADRKKLLNGNGCVLATSGAGKSFAIKTNIEQVLIRYPQDEIIVIDPERRVFAIDRIVWRTNFKYFNYYQYLYKPI